MQLFLESIRPFCVYRMGSMFFKELFMTDQIEISNVMADVGNWYRKHDEDKDCLLPQNLPSDLLDQISKETHLALKQNDVNNPLFRMIVGLLKSENNQFVATKQEVYFYMKAYTLNIVLEGLRRGNIVDFKIDFAVDNVLDLSFERNLSLTDFGRKATVNLSETLRPFLS